MINSILLFFHCHFELFVFFLELLKLGRIGPRSLLDHRRSNVSQCGQKFHFSLANRILCGIKLGTNFQGLNAGIQIRFGLLVQDSRKEKRRNVRENLASLQDSSTNPALCFAYSHVGSFAVSLAYVVMGETMIDAIRMLSMRKRPWSSAMAAGPDASATSNKQASDPQPSNRPSTVDRRHSNISPSVCLSVVDPIIDGQTGTDSLTHSLIGTLLGNY